MNAVRVRVSRLLAALLLLLPLSVQAAEGQIRQTPHEILDAIFQEAKKSTEKLLQLALSPAEVTSISHCHYFKSFIYVQLDNKVSIPEEADKIEQHVSAFLAIYDNLPSRCTSRKPLAKLLLRLETAKHRHADIIYDLLKESDLIYDLAYPYSPKRTFAAWGAMRLLRQLKGLPEPQSSQVVLRLAPLLHESFSLSPRVIETALDVIDSYGAQRSAAEIDALVQAYGKLKAVWQQQRESEAKSASSLTVWDNATEAEVAATLQKFTASICGSARNTLWREYFYVPHGDHVKGMGKPITIVCVPSKEAR